MSFWKPVRQKNYYPLDLDGSLKNTRFAETKWLMPYPPIIGCISGFLPQQDIFTLSIARGKMPSGPNVAVSPINLTYQMNIPELAKSARP